MNSQTTQFPSLSLSLSMMISETAYRMVLRMERVFRQITVKAR